MILDENLFEQTPTKLEDSLQESIDWYGGVQEITRKDYQYFLNCLPPAEPLEQVQGYTGQFLVGEPFMTDDNGHELFSHFGKKDGKYYFLGNHRAKRGSYIGDSEADQDAYYDSMKESVEQPPLWDGKYRPEDITPEYVRKLDMPTSLKLLRWFDKWAEKGVKESVEGDQIAQDYIDSKNNNYEKDKQTTRDMRMELAKQGVATKENGEPITEGKENISYKGYTIASEKEFTIHYNKNGFEYGSYGAVRVKASNEEEAKKKFLSKKADKDIEISSIRPTENEDIRKGIRLLEDKSELLKESAEDCAKAMREQDPLVMNLAMGFAKGNGHILDQVSKGEKTLEQVIEEVSAQSNFLTKEMWDTVIRCAMFCDRGESSKEQTDSLEEDTSAKAYAKKLGQDDIQYFTKKNQFNYDVKQVRIDNTNKTYEFGTFKITSGRESTKNGREFDRLIDKLKELGYTEIKKNVKESAPRQCDKSMCEDINQDTFTDNGLASVINTLIQDEFEAIQGYNDAIVNFEAEGRSDLTQVLYDILNEENLHVGQLETLLEQVSGSANSIDKGKAEAETQLNGTTLGESYGDERYFPYNPELGWTEEDIALHKSIDWKERDYRDYEVAEDSFKGKVYAYGKDIDDEKLYTFHKFLRSNPIFPPYYAAVDFEDSDLVGPMYDGRTHKTYGVHDRYETQEMYDRLSN